MRSRRAATLLLIALCAVIGGAAAPAWADPPSSQAEREQRLPPEDRASEQPPVTPPALEERLPPADRQSEQSDGPIEIPQHGLPELSGGLMGIDAFCNRAKFATSRTCREAGSVFREHEISHYGIDSWVGFDLNDRNVDLVLQWIVKLIWFLLLWAFNAVLAMLQWGFSIDLVNGAMSGVSSALEYLHIQVLGQPWFILGVLVLGLWAIWNSLVRMRVLQTLGGVAASVALMILAMWIITDPRSSAGRAAELSNQTAMTVLTATSEGRFKDPEEGLAKVQRSLFDRVLLRPWCALQFGDVDYCIKERAGGKRIADVWLEAAPGSARREQLFKRTGGKTQAGLLDIGKGAGIAGLGGAGALGEVGSGVLGRKLIEDKQAVDPDNLPDDVKAVVTEDTERVAMQSESGSLTRFALVMIIAGGGTGACLLFGWLAIRLLQAGVWTLILLLLYAWMLIAPAFGETGRSTSLALLRSLMSALFTKLLISGLTAIVVIGSSFLAEVDTLGWLQGWLLLAAFWWGVFLRRHQLLEFMSFGAMERQQRVFPRLAQMYYGWRLTAGAMGAAATVGGAAVGAGAAATRGSVGLAKATSRRARGLPPSGRHRAGTRPTNRHVRPDGARPGTPPIPTHTRPWEDKRPRTPAREPRERPARHRLEDFEGRHSQRGQPYRPFATATPGREKPSGRHAAQASPSPSSRHEQVRAAAERRVRERYPASADDITEEAVRLQASWRESRLPSGDALLNLGEADRRDVEERADSQRRAGADALRALAPEHRDVLGESFKATDNRILPTTARMAVYFDSVGDPRSADHVRTLGALDFGPRERAFDEVLGEIRFTPPANGAKAAK